MARFGCIVIVLALIVLAVVIILPLVLVDNPSINHLMERMLCSPGEIYTLEPYRTIDGGATTFNISALCIGDGDARRDVTNMQLRYGLLGFGGLFVVGLIFFVAGLARGAGRARAVAVNASALPYVSPLAGPVELSAPTLSERLQEIDEAYSKRLITREEYEAARKKAIDEANY